MKNTYATKDFYAAGYLLASGNKLISHSRNNAVTTFYFEDKESLREETQNYYNMKSIVEPMAYGNALKILKSVLHFSNDANTDLEVNNNVQQYRRNSR